MLILTLNSLIITTCGLCTAQAYKPVSVYSQNPLSISFIELICIDLLLEPLSRINENNKHIKKQVYTYKLYIHIYFKISPNVVNFGCVCVCVCVCVHLYIYIIR